MGKDSTESHRPGDRNAFSLGQPAVKIEHQMVLLLRKQEGFLDQLILLSGSGETIYVYSFWDNSEDAEKYDSTTLPKLTKLLTGVIHGTVRVHAFGGPRGRLSSGSREVLC